MRRIGIYARVSTIEQGLEGKTSIEKQIDAGEKQAAVLGTHEEAQIVKVYKDRGASGASPMSERPEGLRMMKDARRGKLDTLIVYGMDRFTRSAHRGLADFEALEAAGVGVIFIKEAIDTSTPSGRLFRTMLAAFAEFEREQIRDRKMAADFSKAKKGIWPGGLLPYGYAFDDEGAIVEHWAEAEIVKHIFRLRNMGLTYHEMAERMTAQGMRTRTGGEWKRLSLSRIIRDDRYGGTLPREFAQAGGAQAETFVWKAPCIVGAKARRRAQKRNLRNTSK